MTTQPNNRYSMEELLSALRVADSVWLFSHTSPDGDTVGSALALRLTLTKLGKRVTLVLDGRVPHNLRLLPGAECAREPERVDNAAELERPGTLAVAVDVASAERMGKGRALFLRAARTAQLDHHETNPGFADINCIDGDAPAVAVLVERVRLALGVVLDAEIAACLYAALSTDTGNFVYRNTDAEAFSMMARLMETGFPLAELARVLFREKARPHLALLGEALRTLRFGEIAGMYVSYAQACDAGATGEHADGVVDYAIDAEGVTMAYFAREQENGSVKVSLRALAPARVDEVAARFQGGGHQLAAGCTLSGPLIEAVARIRAALIEARGGGDA